MHNEVILQGKGIRKEYVREGFLGARLGRVEALKGIDFKVLHRDILGIVGESGSGKSTLAKIICGMESVTAGRLIWRGGGRQAQMIFQNPYNSLNPKLTVRYTLKEAIAYGRGGNVRSVRDGEVKDLLDRVGMKGVNLLNFPHQFSGGQRQRIAIARALALNPGILVCDEPVSALDISIQAQIINLLIDINKATSLTIIFIAHDIEAVSMISKNLIVMKDGLIVERGQLKKVIETPETDYTKQLLDAIPKNPWL